MSDTERLLREGHELARQKWAEQEASWLEYLNRLEKSLEDEGFINPEDEDHEKATLEYFSKQLRELSITNFSDATEKVKNLYHGLMDKILIFLTQTLTPERLKRLYETKNINGLLIEMDKELGLQGGKKIEDLINERIATAK